jgi:hypothetical protein
MATQIPNPELLDLAERLLAYEAAHNSPEENIPTVFHVAEKLRCPFTSLAGAACFRSLASRSLTLTKVKVPALNAVKIRQDGSLEGLNAIGDPDQAAKAGAMLIAQLFALLILFIGERFVLSLVSSVWPDVPVSEHRTIEEK